MTPTRRTVATICAAILSAAAALGMGQQIGELLHGEATTPDSGWMFTPDTTPDEGKTIGKVHDLPTCDELAVWPAMVATHGEDTAAAMWRKLTIQGWTNTYSGDPNYLVAPGCAGEWE